MGKGDRKTAKGKRYNSSYGNARSHTAVTKATGAASAPVAKKATKATKAPAKKVVAKKAATKE
ncbi:MULTISPECIES: 30S ribosomal protein THX [Marilutibacter]|uniref:30S ribosomal protein THX n=2 Tax=Marilutibacter TaxID=3382698 RepID=A0A508AN32_9GAMM|nr:MULTISPECIES: 30S ribosomal protein THX [Lysobacter]MBB1059724.1 30S ribosomal protein THX [Lysobacter spongiae]TQD50887.1 30S ribosomal protein THX [Lysobacter aestuarii]